MRTKQLNIKNRTYHFYNDLINILGFEENSLKLDKKTSMDFDIYYIVYVDKNPEWRVSCVNPLYLMINRIDGFFEDKNGARYLGISDTARNDEVLKKYKQVFDGIKYYIKRIGDNDSKYEKDCMKIKFSSDDYVPLIKCFIFLQSM